MVAIIDYMIKTYKIGDKYNLLTIQKSIRTSVGKGNRKISSVVCKCDCGGETTTTITKLRKGHTTSCGCAFIKAITKHQKTHTRAYTCWGGMKNRCLNSNDTRYKDYGGRGIKVCDSWLKFENFWRDMGDSPNGKSLDRIDVNGNYCKENCRWATPKQQQNNMRNNIVLPFNGITKTLSQWAEKSKLKHSTLNARLRRGWTLERALTTKKQKYKRKEV